MLTPWELERRLEQQRAMALKAQALTPQHSAAEAGMEEAGEDAVRRRREHIQHEVDPYPPDLPEVDHLDCAEVGKRFSQACEVEFPAGYPPLRPLNAEEFRRAPAAAGHAAYSPGYGAPGQAVPVPSSVLSPGMVTRPLLTDGQARACAPEAC